MDCSHSNSSVCLKFFRPVSQAVSVALLCVENRLPTSKHELTVDGVGRIAGSW